MIQVRPPHLQSSPQLTLVPGISHAYGGVLSALSIDYTLTPVSKSITNPGENRWKEREIVTALYVDGEEVIAVSEKELIGSF